MSSDSRQSQTQDTFSASTSSAYMNRKESESDASTGISQSNELAGIGEGYNLAYPGPIDPTLDIQSPGSYSYTQINDFRSGDIIVPDTASGSATQLSHTYQNGAMFQLALFSICYFCQGLNRGTICNEMFMTDEEMQQHFSAAHFEFDRIYPAHKHMCSRCNYVNDESLGPCYNCQAQNSIQTWLCGNYIRTQSSSRYAPDGQNHHQYDPYTTVVSPMPNIAWATTLHTFGGNAGTNQYDTQNGSYYAGPGSQSYDFNSSAEAEQQGSQYMGSNYGGASQYSIGILPSARLCFTKSRKVITKSRVSMLLFSLLVILSLGFSLRWIMYRVEAHYRELSYKLQAQLPIVGSMAFLTSFAVSLLVKYLWDQRVRRRRSQYVSAIATISNHEHGTDSIQRRCPLHSLTCPPQVSKDRLHTFDSRIYVR